MLYFYNNKEDIFKNKKLLATSIVSILQNVS